MNEVIMPIVTVTEFKNKVDSFIDASQKEPVYITKDFTTPVPVVHRQTICARITDF